MYVAVKPDFIFVTEEVALTGIRAAAAYGADLPAGFIDEVIGSNSAKALALVYDALGLRERVNRASLVVWYYYTLEESNVESRVELPVCMIPEIRCTDLCGSTQVPSRIDSWINRVRPSRNKCGLMLDITVYDENSTRVILNLKRVRISYRSIGGAWNE